MTDQEILKKAIEKVQSNGWHPGELYLKFDEDIYSDVSYYIGNPARLRGLILSQDFAKAMWGDELVHPGIAAWKHHLQQMVLEKEPLKYLEQYL